MPPRRGGNHRRARAKPEGAMSTCNLPHGIVVIILSRLPVKSLLRFRCVCKPWRSLFANPRFIDVHRDRTKNYCDTLLVCNRSAVPAKQLMLKFDNFVQTVEPTNQLISLLNARNLDLVPTLDHPFPPFIIGSLFEMYIVGSINGVVCLASTPLSGVIQLWNPATKQYKDIRNCKITNYTIGMPRFESIGFAFDSVKNDYKIVRIVCFKHELRLPTRVEVYSANADTWKEIKVDLPYNFVHWTCDVVVKGVPYWVVCPGDVAGLNQCFLWFDVGNEVFRELLAPAVDAHENTLLGAVNFKDSLALLVYSEAEVPFSPSGLQEEENKSINVWMMDESDGCSWSKKYTYGPILGVKRLVGCSKSCKIFMENNEGVMIMYDPDTGEVKNLPTNGALAGPFQVCCYSESLTPIKESVEVGTLCLKRKG